MIDLRNISYQYENGEEVLNNFNLALKPGDKIGLVGPNGSGKTTLFKIIMGLLTPKQGEVIIFDQKREKEEDFVEVRERVGFLFQDSDDLLFCPTVEEDLAFGPLNLGKSKEEAKRIVNETLDIIGMKGFEKKVSHRLSGGQKRMIAFGAVLAMQPEVLLLDEPFSGLDEEAVEKMVDILNNTDKSYLVVSHNEDLIDKVTNKLYYMNE
ncbi:energy-coupling factor ABC transporter ATP-binding protein [Natroniella acetigena]|uniref:energy-coupling factor ABC transporter ATP-binding protein n=1 Tax=Natroniella acetigena TaxID=52004 RepID=UPI00200A461D|nr:ABC transporter ATP-binding protein [Natroniella acetigena]MCK8826466.1 energy-coupling factor ABC transporter ATP-binding protein [Natroniella acetigena]